MQLYVTRRETTCHDDGDRRPLMRRVRRVADDVRKLRQYRPGRRYVLENDNAGYYSGWN